MRSRPDVRPALADPLSRGSQAGPASTSRRQHRRVASLGRCFAQLGDGWEGSVLNLSLGGMLLRVRKGLTPGSSYYVKLIFGAQVAVVEARVVRLATRDGECLAGMEFLRLSAADRAVLRNGMA